MNKCIKKRRAPALNNGHIAELADDAAGKIDLVFDDTVWLFSPMFPPSPLP
jgi:hypothetical protein